MSRIGLARLLAGGCLGLALLSVTAAAPPADEHYGIPQVKYINEQVAAGWADAEIQPSAAATDGEWCRRLHLDVIGRIPSTDELQRFLSDSTPSKRKALVDRLLGDDYIDEYARNWTDVWTTVLIGRDVANERVNRSGMRQYLRRAFSKNVPYDQFMEELVTATGANANRKDVDGFNGATNFLAG
jgi:hypothetical protein